MIYSFPRACAVEPLRHLLLYGFQFGKFGHIYRFYFNLILSNVLEIGENSLCSQFKMDMVQLIMIL